MRRVLFVDDEQHILDGLRNRLRRRRREWDMVFANGGEAAIAELGSGPFDVVVADMRMPRVDGATLLKHVKKNYPGTARVVLSGYIDDDIALRSIPVAHQFLAKPCEAAILQEVIERTVEVMQLLQNDRLRDVVGGLDALPSRPAVYDALTKVLADPNASIHQVASTLEGDIGVTARVLQLVNSALFGLGRPIHSVAQALGYLGINAVRGLVLTSAFGRLHYARRLPGFSLEMLERRALLGAQIAGKLMDRDSEAEEAFTAAMLRDVGLLILASRLSRDFVRVNQQALRQGRQFQAVENELLGLDHGQIGAYLLDLWGVPMTIVDAVAHHHRDTRSARGLDVAAAVRLADMLLQEQMGAFNGGPVESWDQDWVDGLASRDTQNRWRSIATRVCRGAVDAEQREKSLRDSDSQFLVA